jgi:hypothetical protein
LKNRQPGSKKFSPVNKATLFCIFCGDNPLAYNSVYDTLTANTLAMHNDEKIPLLKKWGHWYVLVVGVLAVLIIFFAWFTKRFS